MTPATQEATAVKAVSIRVRGVVQGVGYRPFVYRIAQANALAGWVTNDEEGVEIYAEGDAANLQAFVEHLKSHAPPAASISEIDVEPAPVIRLEGFQIRESNRRERPTVRISPDLPVCSECVEDLFDRTNRRFHYPYINCTNCGPRYSVVSRLPYDRPNTTMAPWPLDDYCDREYHDPGNRRFHAQPIACPSCGPSFRLHFSEPSQGNTTITTDEEVICESVRVLLGGSILAVKGLGGYHLACDASNQAAVARLRERKYRKEKPFAVMAKTVEVARRLIELPFEALQLLTSSARPIVLAPVKADSRRLAQAVAPDNNELGVMLPYTPLHHLLFTAGAPDVLVMTSANRSSEPIAYEDDEAFERLSGIADAFLIGERPIARRVDDSVARAGTFGPVILRRSRGYAPGVAATIPSERPILALGGDLKNAVTLVVSGQAFVSQHIGDLSDYQSRRAFEETIQDLISMYEVRLDETIIVHDGHPEYVSSAHALALAEGQILAVQHHRAHVASVLAEHNAWDTRAVCVSFDGTGYGDDGTIWGGEIFAGSVRSGFERVAHLRSASLPGGDAAARYPVQAAAGFLSQLDNLPDLSSEPFHFPKRYNSALTLARKGVRTFATTSMGRLFDAAAALLGFTREITFEGQAAMWLEQLAQHAPATQAYPFPFDTQRVDGQKIGEQESSSQKPCGQLDFRPLLEAVVRDRLRGGPPAEIARAFQRGLAQGLSDALMVTCAAQNLDTVVLSGGVFQNEMLLKDLREFLASRDVRIWTNHLVPPNDGGISLGQAAIAAFQH